MMMIMMMVRASVCHRSRGGDRGPLDDDSKEDDADADGHPR